MAADDIFTDDIVPRIRAGHRVLSIVTHEWERVEMMLIDAAEDLNQTLLKWTSASESIIEFNWETGGWQKCENIPQIIRCLELLRFMSGGRGVGVGGLQFFQIFDFTIFHILKFYT